MQNLLPRRSLILGGASSGKSSFAENLVKEAGVSMDYVATAQAFDTEMEAKIAAHRSSRGTAWTTHDAPHDLSILEDIDPGHAVLLDCATMWLSNALLAERDMAEATDAFVCACDSCPAPLVIVSNEVGHGVVPEYAMGRAFRDAQGRLNQRLAAHFDLVVFVTAGLPQVLKGQLP
ncbi:MAG: bifunctional adenosylcobinamide kinase/adenosylcobinamide-phosphate guanylyltransferase [Pseudomonadota bacterium]